VRLRRREQPEWEYVPEGFAREVPGWDVEGVAAAERQKWPAFLEAVETAATIGVNHEGSVVEVDDYPTHNLLITFGFVLALAARGRSRLRVLDWGGGLGHYYVLARRLLPELELEYCCKDVPALAAAGRELLPDVEFTSDDAVLERRFDLVFASGSLQYAEDWHAQLAALGAAAESHLYVTRLPVALGVPSFTVVQRPHAHGYPTEYVGWVVNRNEFLGAADDAGLALREEFLVMAWFSAAGAPEDPVGHRGFLLTAP
jgi:putative methyltransferase (TIGR04325 family)